MTQNSTIVSPLFCLYVEGLSDALNGSCLSTHNSSVLTMCHKWPILALPLRLHLPLPIPCLPSHINPYPLLIILTTAADKRGLSDINSVVKDLAGRAKDGKLKPSEFQGGSFTVSNLGTA